MKKRPFEVHRRILWRLGYSTRISQCRPEDGIPHATISVTYRGKLVTKARGAFVELEKYLEQTTSTLVSESN